MRLFSVIALSAILLTACSSAPPSTLPVPDEGAPLTEQGETVPTLPADWPQGVPTAIGLSLVNAVKLDSPQGPTWSATWQGSGDATEVYNELTDELRGAGFTEDSALAGGGGEGGISAWTRGTVRVQVTVLVENGQVGANVTAIDSSG